MERGAPGRAAGGDRPVERGAPGRATGGDRPVERGAPVGLQGQICEAAPADEATDLGTEEMAHVLF